MATEAEPQLAFDEQVIEDADLEAALEVREKRKDSRNAVQAAYKEADGIAKAEVAKLELPDGGIVRCGRFRITRTAVAARVVSFEAGESSRVRIFVVDGDGAPRRKASRPVFGGSSANLSQPIN